LVYLKVNFDDEFFLNFIFENFSDSNYFKTFENNFCSTVNAVKSKMSSSKSTMNFNGNNNPTGASMTTSVTHDEHLNFGGKLDEKKI
jgi:hypothetical protein